MADRKGAYAELLKDPRWQKLRLEIFERDGWRCLCCGTKDRTLHVHHKRYEAGLSPWEYGPDALATLCEDCHDDEYRNRKASEEYLLQALRDRSIFASDLRGFTEKLRLAKPALSDQCLFLTCTMVLMFTELENETFKRAVEMIKAREAEDVGNKPPA